jgi:hypothetical protein
MLLTSLKIEGMRGSSATSRFNFSEDARTGVMQTRRSRVGRWFSRLRMPMASWDRRSLMRIGSRRLRGLTFVAATRSAELIGVTDHNFSQKTDPRDWFLTHLVEQNKTVARDLGRQRCTSSPASRWTSVTTCCACSSRPRRPAMSGG